MMTKDMPTAITPKRAASRSALASALALPKKVGLIQVPTR